IGIVLAVDAFADDIPIVTLDSHGPSREIPTKSSFYIQGEAAKEVIRAQVVIVRVGDPSLFGEHLFALDDRPSCNEVFATLGDKFTGGSKELRETEPQTTTTDKIWATSRS